MVMKVYTLVLWCGLFTSVAAFTIPDNSSEYSKIGNFLETAASQDCKCKNGRCVTDNRGKTKCNCAPGYALQDDFTCEKCDCGKKGRCMYVPEAKSFGGNQFVKKCICDIGSAEKDGICIDCHCGEHSKCEFEGEEKVCYCIERFSEKDGVCTECDCGFFGDCKFQKGRKKCTCDQGYVEEEGLCRAICEDVDCGMDAECLFDADKNIPTCTCKMLGLVFDESDKRCKAECHDFSDATSCKNGGHCNKNDYGSFCYCKGGTSGFFCEIVDACSDMDCGQDAECEFDLDTGRAECKCKASDHRFDESEKKCKEKCSEYRTCRNGGHCEGGVCYCRYETSGDFCEVIEACDYLCPKQLDINCIYDVENGRAFCKCADEKLGYDPDINQCRPECHDFSDTTSCKNGGHCNKNDYGNFCYCKDGTSGFFCEIVDACSDMDCGQDAKCVFDLDAGRAECKCKASDHRFEESEKKCKEKCSEYRTCRNGGHCVDGVCYCRSETSGDFCEVIEGCDYLCPKQRDINCTYDVENGRAFCKCADEKLGYDPEIKQCRQTCDQFYSVCMNNGRCENSGYSRFCQCLTGTEGDFCEKIPACDRKDCGPEAECGYDAERGSAICMCRDRSLSFDSVDVTCKNTCADSSVCENGGICEKYVYAQFCRCLDGTRGDFCQEILGCKTKDCGDHAQCVYDVEKRIAVCVCDDERYAFDPVSYKCRATCDDYSSLCKNNGTCEQRGNSRFCQCSTGTEGEFCEKIPECEEKDCGSDAICEYDAKSGSPICKCHDRNLSFFALSRKCIKSCHNKTDCKNGGQCEKWGDDKFCFCLVGTLGDACEIVVDCEDKNQRKCQGESECAFDIGKKSAFCQCHNHTKEYDPLDEKCKTTCDDRTICKNRGLCMQFEDNFFCRCKIGTSGELCEIVYECEKGACGDTDATICKYDIQRETTKCECKDADALYDEVTKTCRTCDCGKNAISCEVKDGEKLCVCPEGFGVENGICKKKWCVEKTCLNGKCDIVDDREVCSCFEGYELDGNYCKKLNCTNTPCINGTCVVRHGNIEECVCPAGFTLNRGRCTRGLCKPDTCFGGRCETIEGELICICPDKFHLEGIGCYETVCEIQRCFGGKCVVEDGKEICTCKEGYLLKNDVCKKILCEKKNCFGGQCNIVNGEEECTCPVGYSIFEDVCRKDLKPV